MRLPPSQHHTGLLSTRARKSATAGGTGNSTSTNIKRAAPQAATLPPRRLAWPTQSRNEHAGPLAPPEPRRSPRRGFSLRG